MNEKKEKPQLKSITQKQLKEENNNLSEETNRLLLCVTNKLDKLETSPVLNGGFDVLMEKVKNIESDILELKESVYDQNNGIFTKIKELENENNIQDIEVKNKINIFDEIIQKHDKKIEEESKKTNEYMDKLNDSVRGIETKLSEIDLWKKIIIAVGGLVGGIALNYILKILGL